MNYHAVGNMCAVILNNLDLPIPNDKALRILQEKGFTPIKVDLIQLAHHCIQHSHYKRGANPVAAPGLVDCSGLTKWLYAQRGIWLPRRSIQQRDYGEAMDLAEIATNDLIFTTGKINYFNTDPNDGVGHVGIVSDARTVIHAANAKVGVIETPIDVFLRNKAFRGARRYLPQNAEVITFSCPPHRNVETADDIRWIILQSL